MPSEKHVCTPDCKHGSGKAIWFVVIALIVIVGGYALSRGRKQGAPSGTANVTAPGSERKTAQPEAPSAVVASRGSYEPYTAAKLANAKDGKVVLFFHASWCPTCQALDKDLKSKASQIPANLTVLDIDYDTATDLKKRYGVVMQSTFVQVDENGNQLKKWSESTTLEALVGQLI